MIFGKVLRRDSSRNSSGRVLRGERVLRGGKNSSRKVFRGRGPSGRFFEGEFFEKTLRETIRITEKKTKAKKTFAKILFSYENNKR